MPLQTLRIGSLNEHCCSCVAGIRSKMIGEVLVNKNFDVLTLSETNLKWKVECDFGFVRR